MGFVVLYLIGFPALVLLLACRAAWLRDQLAELLYSLTAGVILLMLLLVEVGFSHSKAAIAVYGMLTVVVWLLCDALIFNRGNNIN